MKKKLFLWTLMILAVGAVFAEVHFKVYPGLYMGAAWTIGGDLQAGLEIGDWDYDEFIFGIHGNIGIDSGLPNKPNYYYGGVAELYYGENSSKFGIAIGGGLNQGIPDFGERNLESVYLRFGVLYNFLYGHMKIQPCLDLYLNLGARLGFMIHF